MPSSSSGSCHPLCTSSVQYPPAEPCSFISYHFCPSCKRKAFWQRGYARFTVNTLKLGASAFQINYSYADDKQVKVNLEEELVPTSPSGPHISAPCFAWRPSCAIRAWVSTGGHLGSGSRYENNFGLDSCGSPPKGAYRAGDGTDGREEQGLSPPHGSTDLGGPSLVALAEDSCGKVVNITCWRKEALLIFLELYKHKYWAAGHPDNAVVHTRMSFPRHKQINGTLYAKRKSLPLSLGGFKQWVGLNSLWVWVKISPWSDVAHLSLENPSQATARRSSRN